MCPALAVVAITGLPASLVRDRLTRLQAYLEGGRSGWRLFHATETGADRKRQLVKAA